MPLGVDTLPRLLEMPQVLRAFAIALPGRERLRPSPESTAFSLLEHACHLRDLEEEGYALRIRRILREAAPLLADFDGAAVASERGYLDQDLASVLGDFEVARRRNVETLREANDAALERTARLVGQGPLTLRQLSQRMLEHDAGHTTELRALVAALGAAHGR
jgi:hypothetical protein